jgi:hypothetical protein
LDTTVSRADNLKRDTRQLRHEYIEKDPYYLYDIREKLAKE